MIGESRDAHVLPRIMSQATVVSMTFTITRLWPVIGNLFYVTRRSDVTGTHGVSCDYVGSSMVIYSFNIWMHFLPPGVF